MQLLVRVIQLLLRGASDAFGWLSGICPICDRPVRREWRQMICAECLDEICRSSEEE